MATVIEDVRRERESEGQGEYAAHFPYAKESDCIRASSQNE